MNTIDGIFAKLVGQGWTLIAASGDQGARPAAATPPVCNFPPPIRTWWVQAGPFEPGLGANLSPEVGWTGGTYSGACSHNNGGSPAASAGGSANQDISPDSGTAPAQCLTSRSMRMPSKTCISRRLEAGSAWAARASWLPSSPESFTTESSTVWCSGASAAIPDTAPCAPLGNANYLLYNYTGSGPTSYHYPFYDITSGCNSNDITALFNWGTTAPARASMR